MAVLGKPEDEKQAPETPAPVTRWKLIPGWIEPWRVRVSDWGKRTRILRRRLLLFLAVVGPGVITSNVDNDAGGISVYSQAGAMYGYALLWSLIPMTIALYVTEEMCARMGVVTGKGLSDLIREEFGFRPTFFLILAGLIVDMGNVCAEFAGVAASMQLFGISKYISVPHRRACRLDSGAARNFAPGGKNISGGLRPVSFLCRLRVSRQAGLAHGRAQYGDSHDASWTAAIC